MKHLNRKPRPFNGMTFTLDGDHHDLGIRNEVAAIQSFSIKLANYIAENISAAFDTFDITQKTANVMMLDGKPIFADTSVNAAHREKEPGSFAAFYVLIAKWDHMVIDDITFVEGLFKECIAFIENR